MLGASSAAISKSNLSRERRSGAPDNRTRHSTSCGILGIGRIALGHGRYAGGFGGLELKRSDAQGRAANGKMSMIDSYRFHC